MFWSQQWDVIISLSHFKNMTSSKLYVILINIFSILLINKIKSNLKTGLFILQLKRSKLVIYIFFISSLNMSNL